MERTKGQKRIPDAINQSISRQFTQVPNQLLRSPEISFKAKGLLCLLLSNRSGWYSYISAIQQMTREGEDAIRSGLAELEEAGYLLRIQYRDKKTKVRRGSFWAYTDSPGQFDMEGALDVLDKQGMEPITENPSLPGKPDVGNPHVEKPHVENPALRIPRERIPNNKNTNSASQAAAADGRITLEQFEQFWRLYPRKDDSKGRAKKSWEKICRKKDRPTWEEVRRAVEAQRQTERWRDKKFIPMPTTWLNQERWLDSPAEMDSYGAGAKGGGGHAKKPPEEILQARFGPSAATAIINNHFARAKGLLTETGNGQLPELAENLVDLFDYIKKAQSKVDDDMAQVLPAPYELVERYIDWVEESRWIRDRGPGLFDPAHKLFHKYLQYEASLNDDRHPLTGE